MTRAAALVIMTAIAAGATLAADRARPPWWKAIGPGLIETYMRGYQGPAMNVAFMEAMRPGLKKGSTTRNGVPFDTYTYTN